MTYETPDDVLEHFGVKGMRWGVRKQRQPRTSAESLNRRYDRRVAEAGG